LQINSFSVLAPEKQQHPRNPQSNSFFKGNRSMKHTALIAAIAAVLVVPATATAQTTIQCHIDEMGRPTAALIWQNTLGAQRANAICQSSVATMNQRELQPTAASAAGISMQPAAVSTPSAMQHPARVFTSDDYIAIW
jgi:hypothetical protein